MSDLYVSTGPARSAIEDLRSRTDFAYSATALPVVDVGNGAGTEALAMLASAVGALPASLMAQISLLAMAMDLGVADTVLADQVTITMSGPR